MNRLSEKEVVMIKLIARPALPLIATQGASGRGRGGILRRKTVGLPAVGLPARVLVEVNADKNIARPVVRQRRPNPVIHIPVLGSCKHPGYPRILQQADQPLGNIQIGRLFTQPPRRPRTVVPPAVARIHHHPQHGSLGDLHVRAQDGIEGLHQIHPRDQCHPLGLTHGMTQPVAGSLPAHFTAVHLEIHRAQRGTQVEGALRIHFRWPLQSVEIFKRIEGDVIDLPDPRHLPRFVGPGRPSEKQKNRKDPDQRDLPQGRWSISRTPPTRTAAWR